jgi:hypothetical protein
MQAGISRTADDVQRKVVGNALLKKYVKSCNL